MKNIDYHQFRDTNYYVNVVTGELYCMKVDTEKVKTLVKVNPCYKDAKHTMRDRVRIDGKTYKIHRVVFEATYGFCPPANFAIHHMNGDHNDNRPSNLWMMTEEDHRELHKLWKEREE